jgi:hypothetical protein
VFGRSCSEVAPKRSGFRRRGAQNVRPVLSQGAASSFTIGLCRPLARHTAPSPVEHGLRE